MAYIKVFTGEVRENQYPESMANSVHFAVSRDGEAFQALNQGYGILFARAAIRKNNTIAERGIRNPSLRKEGEEYLIVAEPLDEAWNLIEEGRLVFWKTTDFVNFSEQEWKVAERGEKNAWEKAPDVEMLEIPDSLLPGILERWMPLCSERTELPDNVCVKNMSELEQVRAQMVYSDGSRDEKNVYWDRDTLVSMGEDRYRIQGQIKPVETGFPLAVGYADPVIFQWDGAWYFLATNDNVNNIGLFVRKADTVEELFTERTREYCILDYNGEKGFCQTFWAPEFHVIGGELYILFAVGGKQWAPQCHLMRLKKGGQITEASDWDEPVRMCRADGRPLTEDGITLDMTYFRAKEKSYVCWSYRYGIGTSEDTGSMLYIATIDETCPYRLTSEPVLLSRPLYGWENTSGTINNEGPYALTLGDKIYLAYSGGDACGYYYAVGYLVASVRDDLLDAGSWTKLPAPVFSSSSVVGIQGPGHGSFFRDGQGRLMFAYHAQEREKYFNRCSAYHRVHISKSGFPLLNVVGERDVAENLRRVELTFRFHPDAGLAGDALFC